MEIFNIVKESVSLVIMGAGIVIAGMALYTWKKEFIGKKKIDLACDIVEQACNIKDIIDYARSPLSLFSEQSEIKEELKKDNVEIKERKIFYLIPKYRLRKNREKIETFLSLRNKAQLYWDKEILSLFGRLHRIIQDILNTSESLYSQIMPEEAILIAKKIAFDSCNETDEIKIKVQKIIDEFKLNLEPLYKDRLTKWKKKDKK